jgi:hypothetical protein
LDGDIDSWWVEGLKEDLGHLFSVGLWVQWGLGQQAWVVLGSHSQLIVEGVVPDLRIYNEFRIYNRLFQIVLLMIYKNCAIYS